MCKMQKKDNINPSHYKDLPLEPIHYIALNKLNYFEGNIIKYVSRYKRKNGVEDLKKAKWYLDYLINLHS